MNRETCFMVSKEFKILASFATDLYKAGKYQNAALMIKLSGIKSKEIA